jgi:hypothetical protein
VYKDKLSIIKPEGVKEKARNFIKNKKRRQYRAA